MLLNRKHDSLDAPMTPAELTAARASLAHTPARLAEELDLTLYELERMEAGQMKIPGEVALHVRIAVVEHQRAEVMSRSGLPECSEAKALAERMNAEFQVMTAGVEERPDKWRESDAFDEASERFDAHGRTCALCRAREDYLQRHAPPMPEFPMSGTMKGIQWVEALGRRAPAFLHPPKGGAGSGRRAGMWIALGLLAISLLRLVAGAVGAVVHGDGLPVTKVLWLAGTLLGFGACMLVVGYLAGWIVDATRTRRHQPTGYVLRGLLVTPILFAAFGAIMVASGEMRMATFAGMTVAMAILGAVVGGIYWVVDRVRGRLPERAAH